jgi:hypothetical protein
LLYHEKTGKQLRLRELMPAHSSAIPTAADVDYPFAIQVNLKRAMQRPAAGFQCLENTPVWH